MRRLLLPLLLAGTGLLAGCDYYRVLDRDTGRVHYTDSLTRAEDGTVTITDSATGKTLTMIDPIVDGIDRPTYDHQLERRRAAIPLVDATP